MPSMQPFAGGYNPIMKFVWYANRVLPEHVQRMDDQLARCLAAEDEVGLVANEPHNISQRQSSGFFT